MCVPVPANKDMRQKAPGTEEVCTGSPRDRKKTRKTYPCFNVIMNHSTSNWRGPRGRKGGFEKEALFIDSIFSFLQLCYENINHIKPMA
jgi:hypothetical protein